MMATAIVLVFQNTLAQAAVNTLVPAPGTPAGFRPLATFTQWQQRDGAGNVESIFYIVRKYTELIIYIITFTNRL